LIEVGDFSVDVNPECSLRIGQHFLIVFMKGAESIKDTSKGVAEYLVNGEPIQWSCIDIELVDPGRDTLVALRHMDINFPNIYDYYVNKLFTGSSD